MLSRQISILTVLFIPRLNKFVSDKPVYPVYLDLYKGKKDPMFDLLPRNELIILSLPCLSFSFSLCPIVNYHGMYRAPAFLFIHFIAGCLFAVGH